MNVDWGHHLPILLIMHRRSRHDMKRWRSAGVCARIYSFRIGDVVVRHCLMMRLSEGLVARNVVKGCVRVCVAEKQMARLAYDRLLIMKGLHCFPTELWSAQPA